MLVKIRVQGNNDQSDNGILSWKTQILESLIHNIHVNPIGHE